MNAEVERAAVELLAKKLYRREMANRRALARYRERTGSTGLFYTEAERAERKVQLYREWFELNRERKALNDRRWRERNPERDRERKRQWAEANRERRNEWSRDYRRDNADALNAARRDRHAENPERERQRDRKRYHSMTPEQRAAYNARKGRERAARVTARPVEVKAVDMRTPKEKRRDYYLANRERLLANQNAYNARKRAERLAAETNHQ